MNSEFVQLLEGMLQAFMGAAAAGLRAEAPGLGIGVRGVEMGRGESGAAGPWMILEADGATFRLNLGRVAGEIVFEDVDDPGQGPDLQLQDERYACIKVDHVVQSRLRVIQGVRGAQTMGDVRRRLAELTSEFATLRELEPADPAAQTPFRGMEL